MSVAGQNLRNDAGIAAAPVFQYLLYTIQPFLMINGVSKKKKRNRVDSNYRK